MPKIKALSKDGYHLSALVIGLNGKEINQAGIDNKKAINTIESKTIPKEAWLRPVTPNKKNAYSAIE